MDCLIYLMTLVCHNFFLFLLFFPFLSFLVYADEHKVMDQNWCIFFPLREELLSPSLAPWKMVDSLSCFLSGNESCGGDVIMTNTCKFQIISYFQQNGTHSIIIILFNDISKVVYPISINVYNGEWWSIIFILEFCGWPPQKKCTVKVIEKKN